MSERSTEDAARHDAMRLRYGAGEIPSAGPWNAHLALLLAHRSVRGYAPDPLAEGTFETLVAAAQSAATSSNLQAWSVIAVDDPAKKAELARIAGNQGHIVQCPLFMVWLADLSRHGRLGAARGESLEAPAYLETFLVAAIDAALAAQNAVVAAESLGLGTVYIGAMRNDPEAVARILGLPDGVFGVFGLCVGVPAPGAGEVKPRLPQEAVAFHGRYGTPREAALIDRHDAEMAEFSRRNGMGDATWSGRVLGRLGRVAAMSGRDRLAAILRGMGFPLA